MTLEGCSNTSGFWCTTHMRCLVQCRDEKIMELKTNMAKFVELLLLELAKAQEANKQLQDRIAARDHIILGD